MSTCPECGREAAQEWTRDKGVNGHQLVGSCGHGHLRVTEWETKP